MCDHCGSGFQILAKYRNSKGRGSYCSRPCFWQSKKVSVTISCEECGKEFTKLPSQIKQTKHNFCSQSCAGKYGAKHKTTGCRRSKLESWLESKLVQAHPNIKFLFNDTSAIQAELDIYIPELNIAFELNGIFHYEDIFANLDRTQRKDKMKVSLCANAGIGLCVIDTSKQRYFKEATSKQFLDIIVSIIQRRLSSVSS